MELCINLDPTTDKHVYDVLVLVVPGNAYTEEVPLLLGTNVIRPHLESYRETADQSAIDSVWTLASKALQKIEPSDGVLGLVKSTKAESIQPGCKKVIHGITRVGAGITLPRMPMMTEAVPEHALPGGLLVTPEVIETPTTTASTYMIQVEIQNVSRKTHHSAALSTFCITSSKGRATRTRRRITRRRLQ